LEDIFITKLYSSGVLRYAETNNDMDMVNMVKYTKKGEHKLSIKIIFYVILNKLIYNLSLLFINCWKFLRALITAIL